MTIRKITKDPRDQYPKPPFPEQSQKAPGLQAEMNPQPDFGLETYKGSGKLKGKVALITGADSGIGRAVALAYAREGANIVLSYLPAEELDAEITAKAIRESGQKVLRVPGDITEEKQCVLLVESAITEFGKLDILVNNAAYQKSFGSIMELTEQELDKTMRTNIYAMFFLSKAAMRRMKPGSTIINTSSIQAYQPDAELLPYATTKGAIVTFTKGLSDEAIRYGIRVNSVAPGPVWTPLIPSSMETKDFGTSAPIGRAAQPVELAPVFVLLASDESSFVTGQVWGVTGGKPLS
jgi:NAD(P)-dependent dehydrogenase (short-subunit alcohol dehydrogenase family)